MKCWEPQESQMRYSFPFLSVRTVSSAPHKKHGILFIFSCLPTLTFTLLQGSPRRPILETRPVESLAALGLCSLFRSFLDCWSSRFLPIWRSRKFWSSHPYVFSQEGVRAGRH